MAMTVRTGMHPTPSMWEERFAADEYVYGTAPNDFLVWAAARLPPRGRVLCLAEGEGRNAVHLAGLGHAVTAVAGSAAALAKALRLAADRRVRLDTVQADLSAWRIPVGVWDGIVAIFAHLPPATRARMHRAAADGLRPGGLFLLEAYTPRQAGRGTGGPTARDLLIEPDDLRHELPGLEWLRLTELVRPVREGLLHTGPASVVQAIGLRKGNP